MHIREDIVQAAAELFGDVGYERARLEDVARALGIKKGSLYYHIDSKEDLLFVIHDRLIDELTQNTVRALDQTTNTQQQIRAILRVAMHLIAEHRSEVTVFLHERHIFGSSRWASIREKRDRYQVLIVDVLRSGVSAGQVRQLPVPLTTIGILGMVNWGYQWFDPDGSFSAAEVADVFADIVLYGILQQPQPFPHGHTEKEEP